MMSLVQQKAPDFTTKAVVGGEIVDITLSHYLGQWIVLFFYPNDFTFVCPTEVRAYESTVSMFEEEGAFVMACSVDSVYTHLAWQQTPYDDGGVGHLRLIHLADVGGRIAKKYGVLSTGEVALRAVFLIDPQAMVRHESVNDMGVGRNTSETLRLLRAFRHTAAHGDMCPANWEEGQATIRHTPDDRVPTGSFVLPPQD